MFTLVMVSFPTKKRIAALLLAAFLLQPAQAVQSNGIYNTTAPTVSDIPNWNTGWATPGKTGWDYVGQVNGASGVYLGNGWVLTAAHVGAGTFTLNSVPYGFVSGSSHAISDVNGTADLTLFQISTSPALNSLTLALNDPEVKTTTNPGSQVAMIGNGGGKSWGLNTVNFTNELITPTGYTYVSNDFITVQGPFTNGGATTNNPAILVSNDSGGADFIYDPVAGMWILAGINEVAGTAMIGPGTYPVSGFVQLNTYQSQIQSLTGISVVPEPGTYLLLGLGLLALLLGARRRI